MSPAAHVKPRADAAKAPSKVLPVLYFTFSLFIVDAATVIVMLLEYVVFVLIISPESEQETKYPFTIPESEIIIVLYCNLKSLLYWQKLQRGKQTNINKIFIFLLIEIK